jgi:hypothetical protein
VIFADCYRLAVLAAMAAVGQKGFPPFFEGSMVAFFVAETTKRVANGAHLSISELPFEDCERFFPLESANTSAISEVKLQVKREKITA